MGFNKKFFTTGGVVASSPSGINPRDHFNTVLYTGNGTTQSISTLDFQPDLVWIKGRNNASWNHFLQDSIRGAENFLISSLTNAEATTLPHIVDSFDANGFTVLGNGNSNNNNDTYVAWCWKAGGAAVSNTDGTITSQVSANTDAGFSIVKYTANATSGATIGHGLNQELDLLIVKSTNLGQAWNVYVKDVTDTSAKYLRLNENNGIYTTSFPRFIPNNFTDSVFSVGSDNSTNGISGTDTYIAYCFHNVDGYQRINTYTGNNSANRIYTTDDGTVSGTGGFQPDFVMVKRTNAAGNWEIWDSLRNPSPDDSNNDTLFANSSAAEADAGAGRYIGFNSDGFTINGDSGNSNASGSTYIYLAIKAN